MQLEKPELVAELILDFLDTTAPSRQTTADLREVLRQERPKRKRAS